MSGQVASDEFLYIVALRDSYQGFGMPDIETAEGSIGVLPAIGTEDQARMAVRALSRTSGVTENQFRICKYKLSSVIECGD